MEDFNNDRQLEMAAKTINIYICVTMTVSIAIPMANLED